ncbi:MAG: phosphoribosylglycinamide formyltransferase [Pseudomonadota bacterium]
MTFKKPIAVLISGSGSNLQALIDACADQEFPAKIVLVISNKENAFGLKRAEMANIPTKIIKNTDFSDREVFDSALHNEIVKSGAEYVCLAGFMRLLTASFVDKWQNKMLNIHPSLLPSFKGTNTHAQALNLGVKIHGCTVHYVVPEMDAGKIIIQAAIAIKNNDTTETLGARVLEAEHIIYPLALKKVILNIAELDYNMLCNESLLIA